MKASLQVLGETLEISWISMGNELAPLQDFSFRGHGIQAINCEPVIESTA